MDNEKGPEVAAPLQEQIDGLVEAVNDDDLLEVLSGLRSLEGEQLNLAHSSTGFSPLQSAVFEQHHLRKLIVHLLLAKGASYKDGEQNAIELARQCGNEEIFELLREWDRGKREGELAELARYLITLTDEQAIAWRQQTIAEEQAHENQLEQEELTAIFNEEQSRLNPAFTNRTHRIAYNPDLPPIRWFAPPDGPHIASVIRLDNIEGLKDDEHFRSFVHTLIEPAMISDITITRLTKAPYAHIYLTSRVDVSSLLRSISYAFFRTKRPHACVGSRLIHINGIPPGVKRKALFHYLKAAGLYGGNLLFRDDRTEARSMYESVQQADAVLQRFDQGFRLGGTRLVASWAIEESEIQRPNTERISLDPHVVDRADAATFAFRVSKLGWRTAVQEYTTGDHTPLPAPLSASPTHRLLPSNPGLSLPTSAPPSAFECYFGDLPYDGIELADVMELCNSILGHLPVDERRALMGEAKKRWFRGSRVTVGLKLEHVKGEGPSQASRNEWKTAWPSYPTPNPSRASSLSSTASAPSPPPLASAPLPAATQDPRPFAKLRRVVGATVPDERPV
ncbi:hypothetical protein BCR35DRAFT_332406 [Leucosporidium creatinivorum]|uniref:Uncharacterized protein n=1 Tax=Leucosporidium creatinivorum TaxID=106004 RepID=A0A1Y2F511_9BASI|nr:hypothetical protein BCR35DRAFT_332406 [Leucosporidium creatinivorum]